MAFVVAAGISLAVCLTLAAAPVLLIWKGLVRVKARHA